LYFRGQVDKYTWVDVGSSYLPGEIIAAFLWAQMEDADAITRRRLAMWNTYHQWFLEAERAGKLRRPVVPAHCVHNAHMYYILLPDLARRTAVIEKLKASGIHSVFHYIPLHSAPAGKKFARAQGEMMVTDDIADRLLRLPMWAGLEERQVEVIQAVLSVL
jgi:dTDP-4-amino-4,6-dideoxygalactose transaminase